MTVSFDPHGRLIFVGAGLQGPAGSSFLQLVLDTGATNTLINEDALLALGYDPRRSSQCFQIVTGSGIEVVPELLLERITALSQAYLDFPVLCHALPPGSENDGLLGLDFFSGQKLTIDFTEGMIALD